MLSVENRKTPGNLQGIQGGGWHLYGPLSCRRICSALIFQDMELTLYGARPGCCRTGSVAQRGYDWASTVLGVGCTNNTYLYCKVTKQSTYIVMRLQTRVNQVPIPRIKDLHSQFSDWAYFTKLGTMHAHEQLALHLDRRKYVTINTPWGYSQTSVFRMAFHLLKKNSQCVIHGLLKIIPNTTVYLGDILINDTIEEEHLQHWLQTNGSRLECTSSSVVKSPTSDTRLMPMALRHIAENWRLYWTPQYILMRQNFVATWG